MGDKCEWILLALHHKPLDRVRLMMALFLFWRRNRERLEEFFSFEPYLYGPCSFEVYRALEFLEREHLIVRLPQPIYEQAPYYLTPRGTQASVEFEAHLQTEMPGLLDKFRSDVEEAAQLGFLSLLRKVYEDAPAYAARSVIRDVIDRRRSSDY